MFIHLAGCSDLICCIRKDYTAMHFFICVNLSYFNIHLKENFSHKKRYQ